MNLLVYNVPQNTDITHKYVLVSISKYVYTWWPATLSSVHIIILLLIPTWLNKILFFWVFSRDNKVDLNRDYKVGTSQDNKMDSSRNNNVSRSKDYKVDSSRDIKWIRAGI